MKYRQPTARERFARCVRRNAQRPFTLLDDTLRTARLKILGYEEWHRKWPKPSEREHFGHADSTDITSSTTGTKKKTQLSNRDDERTSHMDIFQLPLEVRMEIYALVFPFSQIHLTKVFYEGSMTSCIRLEAYPCVLDWEHEREYPCNCLLSPTERATRFMAFHAPHGCVRNTSRFYPVNPNFRRRTPFPGPREKGSNSGAGLWELTGIMYASKAL
jgi:hypothetical protein